MVKLSHKHSPCHYILSTIIQFRLQTVDIMLLKNILVVLPAFASVISAAVIPCENEQLKDIFRQN